MITENYGDIEFIFKNKQNFEACTLLTGWHGIGECGFIAMSHLVDKLKAERIGFIITNNIPQFITIKNKQITFPFEIYRKDDIIIVLPIFEPIKSEHLDFTKALVKWSIDNKFKHTLLVGGLDKRLKGESDIKFINTEKFSGDVSLYESNILDEGLYVTGPLAYMLLFYELYEFPAIAILPYAERSRPDPIAASIAISNISSFLDIEVDIKELQEEAERIEKEIESLLNARKQPVEKDSSGFI